MCVCRARQRATHATCFLHYRLTSGDSPHLQMARCWIPPAATRPHHVNKQQRHTNIHIDDVQTFSWWRQRKRKRKRAFCITMSEVVGINNCPTICRPDTHQTWHVTLEKTKKTKQYPSDRDYTEMEPSGLLCESSPPENMSWTQS